MTTAADDSAVEDAFEAILAGRPVPEGAAGLAAFTGAVRTSATAPGRPNAALAELLATGLLTDQSSPSIRTARSAGSAARAAASRVRIRRRPAMIFPALIAKFLSAGAVAQAATGAAVASWSSPVSAPRASCRTPSRTPSPPWSPTITPVEPPTPDETTEESDRGGRPRGDRRRGAAVEEPARRPRTSARERGRAARRRRPGPSRARPTDKSFGDWVSRGREQGHQGWLGPRTSASGTWSARGRPARA